MAKLKSLRDNPRPVMSPSLPFTGAGGFDLMAGAQPKPDIIAPNPCVADNRVPPLVPGTGMGMGLGGRSFPS